MKSHRGAVPVIVIWLLGLAGASQLVPNWRIGAIFSKKPPTAELQSAQADLAKAKLEAITAQLALKAAQDAEEVRKLAQTRYAQQMAAGASSALKQATPQPAVTLAASLMDRANNGLAQAIGDLPADRQAEILRIVEQSLSGIESELQAAKINLAQRDHDLQIASSERESLRQQIPALQTQLQAKDAVVTQATATVAAKTQEVVVYADKAAAKEREAGSLSALVGQLWRGLGILAVIAILIGCLWLYAKFYGISTGTLGKVVADIRGGGDPIHALDTNLAPWLHSKVRTASLLASSASLPPTPPTP